MKTNKRKKNLKYFCIFLIIIATIYSFNLTSSRYMGKIDADKDIVAIPILTLSNENIQYEIADMLPGEKKEYSFSVSNSDETEVNELLLSYYFQVNLETEIPLTIKLYEIIDDETNEEIVIKDGITQEISIGYEVKTIKNYKLEIIWNESDNSYEYANKKATCNVKLEAIQVDS